MVIDYKGVSFSFDKIKKQKRLQRIRLFIISVIVIILSIFIINSIDSGNVNNIQDMLLKEDFEKASVALENSDSALFHRSSKKELIALLYLLTDRYQQASSLLQELTPKSTLTDYRKFLDYFADRAKYKKLHIFTDYLDKKPDQEDQKASLLLYRAQASTGQFDPVHSTELLNQIPSQLKKDHQKAINILIKNNTQLSTGRLNYIFDCNGKPLAYYDIEKKSTVSLTPGITFDAFNNDITESIKFYRLTIDKGFQAKIHRLFRNYNGSFLLINVSDSSIAAAYSKPLNTDLNNENSVFTETYEPGSIIKLLTLYAYLNALQGKASTNTSANGNQSEKAQTASPSASLQEGQANSAITIPSGIKDIFPLQCDGYWKVDGQDASGELKEQIFHDWFTHNQVENCEVALAISCNIAFARMGVMVGGTYLCDTFNRFYFNSNLKDVFLTFETGTYKKDIPISDTYRLCNLSVGLNEITVTTFHAALLSTIISQNGAIYNPYMIKNEKNLLNIAFYNHSDVLKEIFQANSIFLKIKEGMELAVEYDRGTGRRSQVDFVRLALKTGTAGNKSVGLDAIITGFFPAEKPEYAFAFRLERAGKAEWNGANFLKDFLNAVYQDKVSKGIQGDK